MATIRELFHGLGNIHNMLSVGAGVNKEILKKSIEENKLPKNLKSQLEQVLNGLERLINDVREADKKSREIHDRVYRLINPDTEEGKANAG